MNSHSSFPPFDPGRLHLLKHNRQGGGDLEGIRVAVVRGKVTDHSSRSKQKRLGIKVPDGLSPILEAIAMRKKCNRLGLLLFLQKPCCHVDQEIIDANGRVRIEWQFLQI